MHLIPIEICPWGLIGKDLLVIPCLRVREVAEEFGDKAKLLST